MQSIFKFKFKHQTYISLSSNSYYSSIYYSNIFISKKMDYMLKSVQICVMWSMPPKSTIHVLGLFTTEAWKAWDMPIQAKEHTPKVLVRELSRDLSLSVSSFSSYQTPSLDFPCVVLFDPLERFSYCCPLSHPFLAKTQAFPYSLK